MFAILHLVTHFSLQCLLNTTNERVGFKLLRAFSENIRFHVQISCFEAKSSTCFKKVLGSLYFCSKPSIHSTDPNQGCGGAWAYPRCHRARGEGHPGQTDCYKPNTETATEAGRLALLPHSKKGLGLNPTWGLSVWARIVDCCSA